MARSKKGTNSRTVPLQSGGSITLSYDFDLFDLSPDDREFVNGIIDTLRRYYSTSQATSKSGQARSGQARSGEPKGDSQSSSSRSAGRSSSVGGAKGKAPPPPADS